MASTKVSGKVCPVFLRRWDEFPGTHEAKLQQLEATLGDQRLFASPHQIDYARKHISPDGLKNENDLRSFIRTAIEYPAKDVLQQFFASGASGTGTARITFRNTATGFTAVEPADDEDEPDEPPSKRRSPQKKPLPDRWGVRVTTSGDEVNCFIAEYKAAHKLRAATVQAVLGEHPGDDFFTQVLQQKRERSASRAASRAASRTRSVGGSPLAPEPASPSSTGSRSSSPNPVKGEVRVAMVLCQAFHYMIMSGLACGYIASGGALVFLYVPADESKALYYFPVVFPAQDAGQQRQLEHTALSYLCSFCMFAADQAARSPQWVSEAEAGLPTWTLSDEAGAEPQKSLLQTVFARCADVDVVLRARDDDNDDDAGGGQGRGGHDAGARGRSPTKRRRSTSNAQAPERGQPTGKQAAEPAKEANDVAPPSEYLFCTQACLSGLCRGQAIDVHCPNAAAHVRGGSLRPGHKHMLTAAQVCEGIRLQLQRNLDDHCKCWEQVYGATGVLFKMTLAGYGYTFVAKGTPAHGRKTLEHEAGMYAALRAHQGRAIPVCLGLVHLARCYRLSTLTAITDMLLMSWAGEAIHELDADTDRTQLELERAGLVDDDYREANVVWNSETQRVMRIDFGDAQMRPGFGVLEKRHRDGHTSDEDQAPVKRVKAEGDEENQVPADAEDV